jgi:hypothetical protein
MTGCVGMDGIVHANNNRAKRKNRIGFFMSTPFRSGGKMLEDYIKGYSRKGRFARQEKVISICFRVKQSPPIPGETRYIGKTCSEK